MDRAVLLFDADCGICTRSAAWVAARDRRGRVRCQAAASAEGTALLDGAGLRGVESDTIVFFHGRAWLRSAAVVRVLWRLGGLARLLGALLWLVPLPLRDWGYRWVARNRHRFGGACRLPAVDDP